MSNWFKHSVFLVPFLCMVPGHTQVITNSSSGMATIHGKLPPKTLLPSNRVQKNVLDQPIRVHYEAIALQDLLQVLSPPGWKVQFDIPSSEVNPMLVFHAETSRRRALNQLLLRLGLEGIFYQHKKLILISGREQ